MNRPLDTGQGKRPFDPASMKSANFITQQALKKREDVALLSRGEFQTQIILAVSLAVRVATHVSSVFHRAATEDFARE